MPRKKKPAKNAALVAVCETEDERKIREAPDRTAVPVDDPMAVCPPLLPPEIADTVAIDPGVMDRYAKLQVRLAAAEDLIQAQSDLLDAWNLHKNRNRAMMAVVEARNAYMKIINES